MHFKKLLSVFLVGAFLLAIVVAGIWWNNFSEIKTAAAATTENVTGYAWSSNIGWIKFDHGKSNPVQYNRTSGALSGYAWSSNIGWISFESNIKVDDNGIGGVSASANTTTGLFSGWARACAGTQFGNCSNMISRTDGWDGWIRLDTGKNNPVSVNFSTGYFSGYAWGSEVVGWISFSGSNYQVSIPGGPALTTYNCVSNVCQSVSGSGGTYSDLSACNSSGCGGGGSGTCSDGIMNQDETGIDTGGVCGVGGSGTCSDGIMNQDETGIDIGGVCGVGGGSGTCSDGIQNQDETGIDTGGVCGVSNGAINGSCTSYSGEYGTQPASDDSTGCGAGTYADANDTSTEWKWDCNGSNGGTNVSCGASKLSGGSGKYILTMNISGDGSGKINDADSNILCSGKNTTCQKEYNNGQSPMLSALADASTSSNFEGWSGDCSGTGNCEVTTTATVTATFSVNSGDCIQNCNSPTTSITCDPSSCEGFSGAGSGNSGALKLSFSASDTDGDLSSCEFKIGSEQISTSCGDNYYPSATYAVGSYTAYMNATDSASHTANSSRNFDILRDIQVDFECSLDNTTFSDCSTLSPRENTVVYFSDISIPSTNSSITETDWTFQDGNPAASSNSSTQTKFISKGLKVVTLTATDGRGRTGSKTANINIKSGLTPEWREVIPR